MNCLEFLAALGGVWVEHQLGGGFASDEVLLCQGDSSSASGWLSKLSVGDQCPLHLAIARSLVSFLIDHEIFHYSHWFPGNKNVVADALFWDFDLSDIDAASFVCDCFTFQIPQHFRLVCLPAAVITNVGNLLRLLRRTQQLPSVPAPSAAASGIFGASSSRKLDKSGTPSSSAWTRAIRSNSSHVLQRPSGKGAGHETPGRL